MLLVCYYLNLQVSCVIACCKHIIKQGLSNENWREIVDFYNLHLVVLIQNFVMQIKDGFGEGKDLIVSVMSAMGEEQICGLKDIGPK